MFQVDKEKCVGCEACINICPAGVISMDGDKAQIDANKCVNCGRCAQVCPQDAIYPEAESQQGFTPNQGQVFPNFSSGRGKGLVRGMGRGVGRVPRDGRGRGRGGGGRWK